MNVFQLLIFLVLFCLLCGLNLPPMWSAAPGSLADYPVLNGSTTIDPWIYPQRLGLYKILLTETSASFRCFGHNNTGNVLWGLPLQHGWQYSTSRLEDFSKNTTCGYNQSTCISVNSWWANMNYYLSVVPFLGAKKAGYMSHWKYPIVIRKPQKAPDTGRSYCTTIAECEIQEHKAIDNWLKFFKYLKNLTAFKIGNHKENECGSAQRNPVLDEILRLMWNAHIASIEGGLIRFKPLLPLLGREEAMFGGGWAKLVEYLAPSRWNTNYNMTTFFQEKYLPKRLLQTGDVPGTIKDFTKAENLCVKYIDTISTVGSAFGVFPLKLWEELMCSNKGRMIGRSLIKHIGDLTWTDLIKYAMKLAWNRFWNPCND